MSALGAFDFVTYPLAESRFYHLSRNACHDKNYKIFRSSPAFLLFLRNTKCSVCPYMYSQILPMPQVNLKWICPISVVIFARQERTTATSYSQTCFGRLEIKLRKRA